MSTPRRQPMKLDRFRIVLVAIAACTVAASISLLLDRHERYWPGTPKLPYTDVINDHWLYQSLDTMSRPGDSLGIWGWAAHIWVYSGLVPATRESSTEFAWLDWGPDHYYRQRYLATLVATPPEFFVQAVGTDQFMFTDRATQGLASVPGLQQFVETRYRRLLDDGSIGLYARKDVAEGCCSPTPEKWRDARGAAREAQHVPGAPELNEAGWSISDDADAGSTAQLTLPLASKRSFDKVLVPLLVGPSGRRDGFHFRVRDAAGGTARSGNCDDIVGKAPPMSVALCVITIEPTSSATLSLLDTQPGRGEWIGIGQPVLIHALPKSNR